MMQTSISRIRFSEKQKLSHSGFFSNNGEEFKTVKRLLINNIGLNAVEFIGNYIDYSKKSTFYTATKTQFNIDNLSTYKYSNVVNIEKINNIRWINKFFEAVNRKIPVGGIFIGSAETFQLRRKYLIKKYPPIINFFAIQMNFFIRRVLPKLPILKKVYFFLTKGQGRGLSKAETLGRLVSCGFDIVDYIETDDLLYFIAKKNGPPFYDPSPSYGLLFNMKRIGKNGEDLFVYKFRTMHPYSEYLQEYILKLNGYTKIGKPANDFRLTFWGKFLRRYWLDELPQIINVIRGEMKIVGVRPLSLTGFKACPIEIKEKRIKQKPGCIPPYVALLMQNQEDGFKAEMIYLLEKEKNPYTTDIKFFCMSIYNIVTNKIRSA